MEIISNKEEIFLNKLFDSITEDIVCFDIGSNKGFYSKSLLNNRRDKIMIDDSEVDFAWLLSSSILHRSLRN
jgi:hypothetical protein